MLLSTLEITENEYLIRLNREEYQIGFISQLLKEIQRVKAKTTSSPDPQPLLSDRFTDRESMLRFDNLSDK